MAIGLARNPIAKLKVREENLSSSCLLLSILFFLFSPIDTFHSCVLRTDVWGGEEVA